MRREITRAPAGVTSEDAHVIPFQITNGAGQFACSVIAHAPSREHAIELFEHNWHRIEEAAKLCLANPFFEGDLKLLMA